MHIILAILKCPGNAPLEKALPTRKVKKGARVRAVDFSKNPSFTTKSR